jgi:hypothetical protein
MVAVWLFKLQNKSKLLALIDQHMVPTDAAQIRTFPGTSQTHCQTVIYLSEIILEFILN